MSHRARVVVAGYRGDEVAVRAALNDADPGVRCTAYAALARLGRLRRGDFHQAFADPEATVRRRAAGLLSRLPTIAEGRPSLVGVLADDDTRVVEIGAFALGEQPDVAPEELAALIDVATRHSDSLCRESAVAALGSIGDPAGLAAVLAGTTDRATVRRRAVLALANFEDPAVEEALARLVHDRDIQVRQAAEDLLAISEGSTQG
ncbi:MAG: HEAT repeat domain-containing protein [Microthrixaceae bacterium]|nr:HEAT repeat domain-containing protein [Microthrixaceae bacterium]